MKIIFILLIFAIICCVNGGVFASDNKIHFDFEEGKEGWVIPDWAYYQSDHKGRITEISAKEASHGKSSLAVMCEFPGDVWTAALIEWKKDIDLSEYDTISVDVYLPKKAPRGFLKGRIILTVGEGWYFTEMRPAVYLEPGKWTTLKAKLESEEVEDSDWKGRKEKRLFHHIHNVRKIAVRVEYDASPPHRIGPKYHGPIYVDNMVIE